MRIIGLTGGVGSGKSLAAKILQKMTGGELLIADDLGHLAMKKDSEGGRRIVEAFGKQVLSADGEIDRRVLSELVFGREERLQILNEIIHPQVLSYIKSYVAERKAKQGIIILESAILFETGCGELCDEVWYVWVPEQLRIRRLQESRGYSAEKCRAIMAQQLREEEYQKKCSQTICNDGSVQQLEKILQEVCSRRAVL